MAWLPPTRAHPHPRLGSNLYPTQNRYQTRTAELPQLRLHSSSAVPAEMAGLPAVPAATTSCRGCGSYGQLPPSRPAPPPSASRQQFVPDPKSVTDADCRATTPSRQQFVPDPKSVSDADCRATSSLAQRPILQIAHVKRRLASKQRSGPIRINQQPIPLRLNVHSTTRMFQRHDHGQIFGRNNV
jgi:hypothetical protein